MTEKDPFTFHDERFAAVGDLVVRAAGQAQAELEAIDSELLASTLSGHATMKGLEERKALAESDAAALGAMAAQIDPAYVFDRRKNGARPARPLGSGVKQASPAENAVSNGSDDTDQQAEGIRHRNSRTKEVFEERASRYIRFMVSQGAVVEQNDGASVSEIFSDGVSISRNNWGSLSFKLREVGILTYEKDPATKKIVKASMDRERAATLIEAGDLPQDLAEELEKLDDYTKPEADPETDLEVDNADEVGDEEDDGPEPQRSIIVDKQMRDTLRGIHTRHTGADRHRRAKQR